MRRSEHPLNGARQRGDHPLGRARLLILLALAAAEQGAFAEAREAAEGSLEISTRLGNTEARTHVLCNLAEIELRAGDHRAAARRQLDCLELALELGSLREVSSAWIVAARLAAMTDDWGTATRLQSAADATMARIGLSLYPSDRALSDVLLASATKHVGPSQFGIEIEIGRTLTLTDATEQTRRVLTTVANAGPHPRG